ncbi:hypothetical protein ES703_61559 [subsurface metagenome]
MKNKYAICPVCGKGKLEMHPARWGMVNGKLPRKKNIYVCWVCKRGFQLKTLRRIAKENEKKINYKNKRKRSKNK